MALQNNGPISLADIQGEFGGTNPISLNEYYRGGDNVPSTTPAGSGSFAGPPLTPQSPIQIPTTGPIQLSMFFSTASTNIAAVKFTQSTSWTVPAGVTSVLILVVGGGGGGGSNLQGEGGGGGGAGAAFFNVVSVTPGTSIPITIGAGGAGGGGGFRGNTGGFSQFQSAVNQAIGGGYGGGAAGDRNGGAGGSGGGATGFDGAYSGGVAADQTRGKNGGPAGIYNNGGGGGGFSSNGQTVSIIPAYCGHGRGGSGLNVIFPPNSSIQDHSTGIITPISQLEVAGGGGGGEAFYGGFQPGSGGWGGGGAGGSTTVVGVSGSPNTGGGGGGGGAGANISTSLGGSGGSGVVYVFYDAGFVNQPGVNPGFGSGVSSSEDGNTPGNGFPIFAGIRFFPNGVIQPINSGGVTVVRNSMGTNWYSPTTANIGNQYWIRATASITGQGANAIDSLDTWLPMSEERAYSLAVYPLITDQPLTEAQKIGFATYTFSISTSPTGLPIVAQANCQFSICATNISTYNPGGDGGGTGG